MFLVSLSVSAEFLAVFSDFSERNFNFVIKYFSSERLATLCNYVSPFILSFVQVVGELRGNAEAQRGGDGAPRNLPLGGTLIVRENGN